MVRAVRIKCVRTALGFVRKKELPSTPCHPTDDSIHYDERGSCRLRQAASNQLHPSHPAIHPEAAAALSTLSYVALRSSSSPDLFNDPNLLLQKPLHPPVFVSQEISQTSLFISLLLSSSQAKSLQLEAEEPQNWVHSTRSRLSYLSRWSRDGSPNKSEVIM
jgi:hypothetical protein